MSIIMQQVGDLLGNVTEGHIIHGCNCQGSMGAGIALAIKNKWPIVYDEYRKEYEEYGLHLGQVIPVPVSEKLIVWNVMTQDVYRGHPKAIQGQTKFASYDAIHDGFFAVSSVVPSLKEFEQEIHFPLIGAGLGGANWDIIKAIIEDVSGDVPCTLWTLD